MTQEDKDKEIKRLNDLIAEQRLRSAVDGTPIFASKNFMIAELLLQLEIVKQTPIR